MPYGQNKVSLAQYRAEWFPILAGGQAPSGRFSWNKGCHIENLRKVMLGRPCRTIVSRARIARGLFAAWKRYSAGLSRTIKSVRPSSRWGITLSGFVSWSWFQNNRELLSNVPVGIVFAVEGIRCVPRNVSPDQFHCLFDFARVNCR